jgi:hypothetical protein
VAANACRCGLSPEMCIQDDELLTQHTWKAGSFNDEPRATELELSMLRGHVSVVEACDYRSSGVRLSAARLAKAATRQTTAGKLRAAGFAVVHTPGQRIKNGIHVSIIWPPGDPLHVQRAPWPAEVSQRFAACFNKEGEVDEIEP